MRKTIATLPSELMRSVTRNQGPAMARRRSISVVTGVLSTSVTRTRPY